MELLTVTTNEVDLGRAQFVYNSFMNGALDLGSFQTNLFNAIKYADKENTRKLAKGFPSEILASLIWVHGERYEFFEEFYGLKFVIERATKYIHKSLIHVAKLKENIKIALRQLEADKEDTGIVEIIVNGSDGVYVLNTFGKMFDIEPLMRDPYKSEGYWDDWTYTVGPQCEEDIETILNLGGFMKELPEGTTLQFGFTEGGGDLALMLALPEGYWEEQTDDEYEKSL
jgi:hypothetical protein